MSPKSVRVDWPLRKLELHSMPVHKFGQIYPIMANVMFGHWAVYYTKWHHLGLLSSPMISPN